MGVEVLCATRKHLFVLQSFAPLLYPSSTFKVSKFRVLGCMEYLALSSCEEHALSLSLSRHRPKNEIAKKFDVCRGFLDLRRQDGTPPTITCSVVDFDEGLDTQYCLQYFIYEI